MQRDSKGKEKIIRITTELIRESAGNISAITTRAIAERAGIGVGLVNYHFQTKENLITICVQRIINQVISGFASVNKTYCNDRERLTDWAVQVFDFLFENDSISRISILGDYGDYTEESNSARSQKGFALALQENRTTEEKNWIAFLLTSALQTAFLGKKIIPGMLRLDMQKTVDRHAFVEKLVAGLLDGFAPSSPQS